MLHNTVGLRAAERRLTPSDILKTGYDDPKKKSFFLHFIYLLFFFAQFATVEKKKRKRLRSMYGANAHLNEPIISTSIFSPTAQSSDVSGDMK